MAQVTADGRFLTFDSVVPLTGYNNEFKGGPVCAPEEEIKSCGEVFEYDAGAEEPQLRLVQPDGSRPRRPVDALAASADRLALPAAAEPHAHRPRLLRQLRRAVGRRSLARGRERVRVRAERRRAAATGAAGCTFLLSSGRGTLDASFLSADETGSERVLHDAAAAGARRPRRTGRSLRRSRRGRVSAASRAARAVHRRSLSPAGDSRAAARAARELDVRRSREPHHPAGRRRAARDRETQGEEMPEGQSATARQVREGGTEEAPEEVEPTTVTTTHGRRAMRRRLRAGGARDRPAFAPAASASRGIEPGSFHAEAINATARWNSERALIPTNSGSACKINHDANNEPEGSARTLLATVPAGVRRQPDRDPALPARRLRRRTRELPAQHPDRHGAGRSCSNPARSLLEPAGALYNLVPPEGRRSVVRLPGRRLRRDRERLAGSRRRRWLSGCGDRQRARKTTCSAPTRRSGAFRPTRATTPNANASPTTST